MRRVEFPDKFRPRRGKPFIMYSHRYSEGFNFRELNKIDRYILGYKSYFITFCKTQEYITDTIHARAQCTMIGDGYTVQAYNFKEELMINLA